MDRSFWGVQGWEVTVTDGSNGFCFGAAPTWPWVGIITHFANNIANGCEAGGFVSFNVGNRSGLLHYYRNLVQRHQGTERCIAFSARPIRFRRLTFMWLTTSPGAISSQIRGGVQAWGGDGIIFVT